jgi:hypothetical protein
MWPAVIAPSPNASARFGVAANVADRSLDLPAAPTEQRSAAAIADSGNDDTAFNCATSPACWASNHALASRTATSPDCTSDASAPAVARTAAIASTRSITPLVFMVPS